MQLCGISSCWHGRSSGSWSSHSCCQRYKTEKRKRQTEGEQHPVSNVTPIKTCCIIYTGRKEQHLSPVCQETACSCKDFTVQFGLSGEILEACILLNKYGAPLTRWVELESWPWVRFLRFLWFFFFADAGSVVYWRKMIQKYNVYKCTALHFVCYNCKWMSRFSDTL